MKLVLIPGAYASPVCWEYFEREMPNDVEFVYLEYNAELPLEDIIKTFEKKLNDIQEDVVVVGHSLGGVIALELSHRCKNIKKVISVAAPFGGLLISKWMIFVSMLMTPFNNIWANTHPANKILVSLRTKDLPVDTFIFLVETKNSTMWFEPSDGIVTINSQQALGEKKNSLYGKIYCTHADAILHRKVIDYVKETLGS